MNDESALAGIAALSNKSRWEIFWLLVNDESAHMSAGDIGEHLKIAPATLSFHLKELTHAGLLHATRSGSRRLYAPDCKVISQIADYLTRKCANANSGDGDDDKNSPQGQAESRVAGHEWVR